MSTNAEERRQAARAAEELVLAAYGAPEARVLLGPEGAEAARLLLVDQGWATSQELATCSPDVIRARISASLGEDGDAAGSGTGSDDA